MKPCLCVDICLIVEACGFDSRFRDRPVGTRRGSDRNMMSFMFYTKVLEQSPMLNKSN